MNSRPDEQRLPQEPCQTLTMVLIVRESPLLAPAGKVFPTMSEISIPLSNAASKRTVTQCQFCDQSG